MNRYDRCVSFISRGTVGAVPTIQCRRRWRWSVIMWPGEHGKEIESHHCTQHKDQTVLQCLEAKVRYRLIDRGQPRFSRVT